MIRRTSWGQVGGLLSSLDGGFKVSQIARGKCSIFTNELKE
jgi:hypothetical protein